MNVRHLLHLWPSMFVQNQFRRVSFFSRTMATHSKRRARHHFVPLGSLQHNGETPGDLMRLQGIIFDMDGTLCEPQNHMFGQMREAVGIPADKDILDYVHSLPDAQQDAAFAKIQEIERQAMADQIPQAGLVTLMEYLDQKRIPKGICTRNFDAPVTHLLKNHIPSHINPFSPIVTRDFRPPKPSPAGILHIASAWGIETPSRAVQRTSERQLLPLIMVGDSIDDMTAGYEAGALTVLLRSAGKEELEHDERTDVSIDRLDQLVDLLAKGLKADPSHPNGDAA